jgi:hypothetical protein
MIYNQELSPYFHVGTILEKKAWLTLFLLGLGG